PTAGNLPGGRGGGLYNEGVAAITDSTFSRNRAISPGGGDVVGGRGGGIWNGTDVAPSGSPAALFLLDSTLTDNLPQGGPGSGTVGGRALGGGIFNRHATVIISGSTLSGNQALAGVSATGAGNFGGGGAIANTTGGALLSILVISNSTLTNSRTV